MSYKRERAIAGALLLDIEGTTTSMSFVYDVLFPYCRAHLRRFLVENAEDERVRACLDEVGTIAEANGQLSTDAVSILEDWIAQDRKYSPLKRLQGMIWKAGYEQGAYRGHLYADVSEHLHAWVERGVQLATYSSGSVLAQKLLFAHSESGDLSTLFCAYFDTAIGAKQDPQSYEKIAASLGMMPGTIAFLSDVEAELNAAQAAGFITLQVVRASTQPTTRHPTVRDFREADTVLGFAAMRAAQAIRPQSL